MKRAKARKKMATAPSDDRTQRIRLLNDEVVQLRQSTLERTKSLETKLTSVGVTGGVLASLTSANLDRACGFIDWLPLGLSLAVMVIAAVGLRLYRLEVPDAKELVRQWRDADFLPTDVENSLLNVRVKEITSRDKANRSKAKFVISSFILLIASFAVTIVVSAIRIDLF